MNNKIKYGVCGHDLTISQLAIRQVMIIAEVALEKDTLGDAATQQSK